MRQKWWSEAHKIYIVLPQLQYGQEIYYHQFMINNTQHIEDNYQEVMIAGTAFGHLSAAYDTVNHRLLLP